MPILLYQHDLSSVAAVDFVGLWPRTQPIYTPERRAGRIAGYLALHARLDESLLVDESDRSEFTPRRARARRNQTTPGCENAVRRLDTISNRVLLNPSLNPERT
jgi:hypothetical protein